MFTAVSPLIEVDVKKRIVRIDGRLLPVEDRGGGNIPSCIAHDPETGVYVKLGWRRANKERSVYARAKKAGLEQHFARIVASGPGWNAFEEVKHDPSFRKTTQREIEAEKLLAKFGLWDYHPGNWNVNSEGVVVIIDYAN